MQSEEHEARQFKKENRDSMKTKIQPVNRERRQIEDMYRLRAKHDK